MTITKIEWASTSEKTLPPNILSPDEVKALREIHEKCNQRIYKILKTLWYRRDTHFLFHEWLLKNYDPHTGCDTTNLENACKGNELASLILSVYRERNGEPTQPLSYQNNFQIKLPKEFQDFLKTIGWVFNKDNTLGRQDFTLAQHIAMSIECLSKYLITHDTAGDINRNTILLLTTFLHDVGKPIAISKVVEWLSDEERKEYGFINENDIIDREMMRDWQWDNATPAQKAAVHKFRDLVKDAEEGETQEIVKKVLPDFLKTIKTTWWELVTLEDNKTRDLVLELVKKNPLGNLVHSINYEPKSIAQEIENLLIYIKTTADGLSISPAQYWDYLSTLYCTDLLSYTAAAGEIPIEWFVHPDDPSGDTRYHEGFTLDDLFDTKSIKPWIGAQGIKFANPKVAEAFAQIKKDLSQGIEPLSV